MFWDVFKKKIKNPHIVDEEDFAIRKVYLRQEFYEDGKLAYDTKEYLSSW